MTDNVLTIKEVADLLKLAEKTVYSMAQRGELPAFKVRGQWRIQRVDLQAWIESQKRTRSDSSAGPERATRPSRGAGGPASRKRKVR